MLSTVWLELPAYHAANAATEACCAKRIRIPVLVTYATGAGSPRARAYCGRDL
jgi:hypothetical protein